MFSMFCHVDKKELHEFKGLNNCLKNRQFGEASQKQRKIRTEGKICSELSTRSVDAFYLAPGPVTLQQGGKNQTW
jgi:hypothetical protein